MVTSSKDNKGNSKSPVQPNATPPNATEPSVDTNKEEGRPEAGEPLAPPPRPAAGGDYFSSQHPLQLEKNPFETSFAGGNTQQPKAAQTPGGTTLPGITSLTSPALPGTGLTPGFWADGLRTGPLSPAMLSGPATGKDNSDYFSDRHFTTGVTPNESSIRSGLTPGGGGSMFPQPSPNSQALFEQLASGGATPNTIDFHRTALAAAAANKRDSTLHNQLNITSQPQVSQPLDAKPSLAGQFDQHDANDAANGLFLLAQARNPPNQQTNHYAPVPQMSVHAHPQQTMQMGSTETSPNMAHRNGGSISTNSGRGVSEMSIGSDEHEQSSRPNTRGKGKRGAQTNGRRKAEDTPSKAPANKRLKMEPEPSDDGEEEQDMNKDEYNAQGKKMTDEEKRKNFLERNRVAALKCRQRKKQWLANLQQKVEIFSSENDNLSAQISQLREEVVNLKTLLLAHKDCPVSHQQGLHGLGMEQLIQGTGYPTQMAMSNPYNIAGMQAQVMAGSNMQGRRYS